MEALDPEEGWLVGEDPDVGDRRRTVGDGNGQVDKYLVAVVAAPARHGGRHGIRQHLGETDIVDRVAQQRGAAWATTPLAPVVTVMAGRRRVRFISEVPSG